MPKPPPADSKFWKAFTVMTKVNTKVFRATDGRLGSRMPGYGSPICLVNHVGRKSGTPRTSPLIYLWDDPNVVIVASKGGSEKHPAWYHNVMAADTVEVELPKRGRRPFRPRVASDEEREQLWPRLVDVYKPYAEYQTYTSRKIPVVVLEPAHT